MYPGNFSKSNRQLFYVNNMSERKWTRPNYRPPELKTSKNYDEKIETEINNSTKVLELIHKLGVTMTQVNGQRKISPPPDWSGPPPDPSCEVFVGKIPRNVYEDVIHPIFNRIGPIYEMRLMMDFSGSNRGYCFVMYTNQDDARRAIVELNNYEIQSGHRIGVVASINNCRLCVTRLPKDLNTENFIRKICEMTNDVRKISVYRLLNKNQPKSALIFYNTHMAAALARRRLVPERNKFVGNNHQDVIIDWARPNFSPSNVLEESGVMNEDGEVIIKKCVIESNNNYQKKYHQNQTQESFGQNMMKKIPGIKQQSIFVFKNKKKINNHFDINENFDKIQNHDNLNKKNDSVKMFGENLPGFLQNFSFDQQDFCRKTILNNNFDRGQMNDNNSMKNYQDMSATENIVPQFINLNSMNLNQNYMEPAGSIQTSNETGLKQTTQFIRYSDGNLPFFMAGNWPFMVPVNNDVNYNFNARNEHQAAGQNANFCCMLPVNNQPAIIPATNSHSFINNQVPQKYSTGKHNFFKRTNAPNYSNNSHNFGDHQRGPRPILNTNHL